SWQHYRTADRNRSHWSTSKTPSYTKSVSWQHHPRLKIMNISDDHLFHSLIKTMFHFYRYTKR
ncbi:hypothetical protein, partial [Escherichia coli]|uniref:hypothetical protein n=1 Tax=Escherichia coli TaxID=562 RepID=UPI001BC8C402